MNFEEIKEKIKKFYEEHKDISNIIISGITGIIVGYWKGKSDSIDKISNMRISVVNKQC